MSKAIKLLKAGIKIIDEEILAETPNEDGSFKWPANPAAVALCELRQALTELQAEPSEFTKEIRKVNAHIRNTNPSQSELNAADNLDEACDLIDSQQAELAAKDKRIAELEELVVAVQLTCNPPKDCNDPKVLKTYMLALFAQAEKISKP